MAMTTSEKVVAKGAALLDDKVPGWWKVINLQKLDINDCHTCMLGQLFGYEVETALGAALFGLPTSRPVAACGRPLTNSELTFNGHTGYARGVKSLDLVSSLATSVYTNELTTSSTGVNIGISNSYENLRCAWAKVIAERRVAEEGESNAGQCETSSTHVG